MQLLRRKYYKRQLDVIALLIADEGPGHWEVLGPRVSDASILVIQHTYWRTWWWMIKANGQTERHPALGAIDPGEFGARHGVWGG